MNKFLTVFRLLLAAGAMAFAVPNANAECKTRLMGDTAPAYIRKLETRMHDAGLAGQYTTDDGTKYLNFLYRPAVSLKQTDTILEEIRTGLAEPYSIAELDHLVTISAFTVALYSGTSEIEAREQIYNSIERNKQSSTWAEHFGDVVAVITRFPNGVVVAMGKLVCS